MKIPEKLKGFINDSMWSIAGLVLMNMVAQFIVYPIWNSRMGSEAYGNVLYLISLMNILAISAGTSCNSARMVKSASSQTQNGDYGIILAILSAAAVLFGAVVYWLNVPEHTVLDTVLFITLTILTLWRFYSDVQYRLSLNYFGYFRYYLAISLGYLVGVVLFGFTGLWPLALIPGELAGLGIAYFYRSSIRSGLFRPSKDYREVSRLVLTLTSSSIISQLIFNGDRLLLNLFVDGNAVTIYYLASLLGKTMSLITTPLNSVIMGYLARFKGNLTVRIMNAALLICVAAIVLGTAACTVASLLLIKILYPQNFDAAQPYFVIANLTQIIYFVGNVTMTLLLRFSKAKYQMTVNVFYAITFVVLCVPATYIGGITGFCAALLATNLCRLLISLFLGYRDAFRVKDS